MTMTPDQIAEANELLGKLRKAQKELGYWKVDTETTDTDQRADVLRDELDRRGDHDDLDCPISEELVDKMFAMLRQEKTDEYAARVEALTKDLQNLGVKL